MEFEIGGYDGIGTYRASTSKTGKTHVGVNSKNVFGV
jgi:hypothetical protein